MPAQIDEDVIRTGILLVQVEGIGRFQFRRRTLERELRSSARYQDLTGGLAVPGSRLDQLATALGDYEALAETWPDGWSPTEVRQRDMIEAPEFVDELLKVWAALLSREDVFRARKKQGGEAAGAGAAKDPQPVVPAKVQPAAE